MALIMVLLEDMLFVFLQKKYFTDTITSSHQQKIGYKKESKKK